MEKKLQSIENQTTETENNLTVSNILLQNATKLLQDAQNAFNNIYNDPLSLERDNIELNSTLENNYKGLTEVEELVPVVQEHASNLSQRAQELDNLLTETRNFSKDSVKAANAYKNIVDAIDNAHNAAEEGIEAATNAESLLNNIAEDTGNIFQLFS